MLTAADELLDLAAKAELVGELDEEGTYWWHDVVAVAESLVPCVFRALDLGEDEVGVELGCPVLSWDPDRLWEGELPLPLCSVDVDLEGAEGEADESGADDARMWLLVDAVFPWAEGPAGLLRCRDAARAHVAALAGAGIVDVVDAFEVDPSIAADLSLLAGLKARRPWDALELAVQLAARCRSAGDFIRAARLDLAAGEVAWDLGDGGRCFALTDAAWSFLGRPVDDPTLASAQAKALFLIGQQVEALELLRRAEVAAPDRAGALLAMGNRGVLLAAGGRFPEAIEVLGAVLHDDALEEDLRVVFRSQLAEARRSIGILDVAPDPVAGLDVIDSANEDLNDMLAMILVSSTPAARDALLPELEVGVTRVRARWEYLGPGQRARLLMVEGYAAFSRGDLQQAGRLYRVALSTAEDAGDRHLVGAGRSLMAALAAPAAGEPPDAAPPRELLAHAFNSAYRRLHELIDAGGGSDIGDVGGEALELVLAAVRALDGCRHEFADIADRRAWASLGERVYELALGVAVVLDRRSLVVELLERMRAQGVPAGTTEQADGPQQPVGVATGSLTVDAGAIATVTGRSEIDEPTAAIPLDEVVATIGGPGAWWWSCRTIGRRVYWAVRRPDGGLEVARIDDDVDIDLDRVGTMFVTPRTDAQRAEHILVDDAGGRLESVLDDLASVLLPQSLASAATAATRAGQVIRVVWAPPPTLGRLPVALLPLGGGRRLLHGAAITVAPPTALVRAVAASPVGASTAVPAVVIGDGLRYGREIVGGGGLDLAASEVLGPAWAVTATPAVAAALATPAATLEALARRRGRPFLYYGHVDPARSGSPLTASLRLTDGRGRAPLEVGTLLAPERSGAPETVVLCGCSSLEPASVGSGEWWGFGVGLLWQGSRQVIGSVWSPFDCPATMRFAVELVSRLRTGEDPAIALRQLQCAWLSAWEDEAARPFSGEIADHHPIVWAGWEITGVHRDAGLG